MFPTRSPRHKPASPWLVVVPAGRLEVQQVVVLRLGQTGRRRLDRTLVAAILAPHCARDIEPEQVLDRIVTDALVEQCLSGIRERPERVRRVRPHGRRFPASAVTDAREPSTSTTIRRPAGMSSLMPRLPGATDGSSDIRWVRSDGSLAGHGARLASAHCDFSSCAPGEVRRSLRDASTAASARRTRCSAFTTQVTSRDNIRNTCSSG
jgi:hypothetical protein